MYIDNTQDPEAIKNIHSKIKRYDVINYLIDKYNLINYLEIGVFNGENIRKIKAQHKDGVDPGSEGMVVPEVNFKMTSDEFFNLIKGHDIKYDIIFIDGLHHSDQVKKDIQNSLNHIIDGGFIVLHDCNPISFESQLVPRQTIVWNGDCWEAFVEFRDSYEKMKSCTIDTDFGVGVIQVGNKESIDIAQTITWEYFDKNRKKLLNLISFDEFKEYF